MNDREVDRRLREWAGMRSEVKRVAAVVCPAYVEVFIEPDMRGMGGVDESGGFAAWADYADRWHDELASELGGDVRVYPWLGSGTPASERRVRKVLGHRSPR